jgi:hypothetical protein
MNEIQFLRTQLAREHEHLESVVKMTNAAIASTADGSASSYRTNEFLKACADYLLRGVKLLEARDRARLSLHYARKGSADQATDSAAMDLERTIEEAHSHWGVLEGAAPDTLGPLLHRPLKMLGNWLNKRKAAAASLDDAGYSVEDWRSTAFVNAGSIVEERKLYQRVESTLPVGINSMKADRHGH